MSRQCILTIEDDAAIRRGIVDALRFAGYEPLEAGDGEVGLEMATKRQFDLLLLDLVLPKRDGFEILREVRRLRPTLPVIILTARGEEADRVTGLRDGADDYVVKPFSVKELLARVEAVLRRSAERPAGVAEIKIPGGTIDLDRREVRYMTAAAWNCRNARSRSCATWRATPAGPSPATNCWPTCGASRPRASPRGRSTCTSPASARNCATTPTQPAVILTVRGKGYMFAECEKENAGIRV